MAEMRTILGLLFALAAVSCRPGCSETGSRRARAGADERVDGVAERDSAAPRIGFARPWTQTLGGPGGDEAAAVAVGREGAVIVAGSFGATATVGEVEIASRGETDAFLIAFTPAGEIRWLKTLGGPGGDSAEGVSVGTDGNLLVTGWFEGHVDFDPGEGSLVLESAGEQDVFVVSLDEEGTVRWARVFGGAGWDEGHGVVVSSDGEIAVVGSFSGTVDFDPGAGEARRTAAADVDAFVVCLNADGSFRSVATFGGSGADVASSVSVVPGGAWAVAGWFSETVEFQLVGDETSRSSAGFSDVFVLSVDAAGSVGWVWTAGGPLVDQAVAVASESDGALWVTGFFVDRMDVQTQTELVELRAVGRSDVFVARLQATGEPTWATGFGGEAADYGYAVAVSATGDALIAGRFAEAVDLDERRPDAELVSAGRSDAFVVGLGASGALGWARSLGGPGIDVGQAIVAVDGTAIIVGAFEDEVDFAGAPVSNAALRARGASDAFVAGLAL
jgi:hypothetical protein